jgi:hypothetical protein
MASSLLDRVKRPPQSAETFIAAADAEALNSQAPSATNVGATQTPTSELLTEPPAAAKRSSQVPRARRTTAEDPRKHDVPRYTFNLRLNDYELELLRSLADEQRESMQKIVKNGLIPYLESKRKTSP